MRHIYNYIYKKYETYYFYIFIKIKNMKKEYTIKEKYNILINI